MESQGVMVSQTLGLAGAIATAHPLREEWRGVHEAWHAHVRREWVGAVTSNSCVPGEGARGRAEVGSVVFHNGVLWFGFDTPAMLLCVSFDCQREI